MNTKLPIILVLVMSLVISSCGQGQSLEPTTTPTPVSEPTMIPTQVSEPTMTPAPTITPIITESPIPSLSHTPDPEAVKLLKEAFSFSKQGEDEKAIEAYTKAIEVDPLYGQPYFNRGSIYADHRELEKALADFNKGLELDPTNPLGYSNRAQDYIELEKLDEALKDIKSLLSVTKDDEYIIQALTIGGHIYDIQDEPFLALAAYTAALEMDEHFTPALMSRGQIYLRQNDWLRAFSDLTLVLESTNNPELRDASINILMRVYPEGTTLNDATTAAKVHYDKGMQYKKSGDYTSSSASLSKAIEIDPLNSDYYFERSLNLANGGEFEKAITDMNYSIALLPSNPRGYYFRGLMEADYNMVAEGIADLEKALEFDLSADAKGTANQKLQELRQRLELCQFTAFEAVNDAKVPTFLFTFQGPPNTDFAATAFNTKSRDEENGIVMFAKTPEDGVTPTGIEYKLHEGETTPIELDIRIAYSGCMLHKTAIWPEIDILALLSGVNP
jgi:tetratricopeptide (TPR) repeat protein